MDFFDEEKEENSDGENSSANNDTKKNEYTMPKGAKTASDSLDLDFWEGITQVNPAKKRANQKHLILFFILSIFFLSVGFGIGVVSIRGQGVLSNLFGGDKHINFTLPVSDKPDNSVSNKTENGQFTTEGLSSEMSSSICSIETRKVDSHIKQAGQGSGIIMTSDGYIVTNAHVVDGDPSGIKVVLFSGAEYEAKIIGMDSQTDIAVIKIPASNLSPVTFGNSDDVNLGEDILTIGSPAGYYGTVTKGIVSGLNRRIKLENGSAVKGCIQVDAPINPGNSGGALFNMWGQVIGITSSKLESADFEGIGFAISTNVAKPVIEQLMEHGEITDRVKIGITYRPISDTIDVNTDKPLGIYVAEINEDCDVANSGLKVGDIITHIDGENILYYKDISDIYRDKKAGDEVTCSVYRLLESGDYEEHTFTFKLMQDNGTFIETTF